jgi:hypothetical protein
MATKVEIIYEAEATSLKATVNEVNKANDAVAASAKESSKEVADAYKSAGKSIAAAFSGGEVKKALADQNKGFEQLNSKGKTLTGQLRDLKNQLTQLEAAGQDGTAQFQQLTIAAARLEDQIGDTRQRVQILASDTFKFDAAVGAVQGLAAGFEIAEGASALFGAESEDLQKALLKLNAVTAVATGLQQVAALVKEESAIKTLVLANATAAYNVVVGTSTGALKAFRIALAATGVGLLVIGLIALVENFDKVKRALENSIPGFKAVSNAIGDAVDTIKEWVGASDDAERAGAAFDAATKKQNAAADAVVKSYERRIAVEKAAGRSTTELEIQREQAVIDANQKILTDYRNKSSEIVQLDEQEKEKAIQAARDAADAIAESQNNILIIRTEAAKKAADIAAEAAKKQAETELEVAKASRESINKLDEQNAEFSKNLRLGIEQEYQKELQKLAEDKKKRDEEIAKSFESINEELLDGQINRLKRLEAEEGSTSERRIQLIELESKKQIDAIRLTVDEKAKADNQIKIINAETQAAIREEQKKTRDEAVDYAFQIASEIGNSLSAIVDLQNQFSQQRIESIQEQSNQELEAINKSLESEVVKENKRAALQTRTQAKIVAEQQKQARREKALNIFKATIDTAASIVKTGAQLGYPAALPFQILAGIIGAANIAAIAAQPLPKFKRGGMVGGQSHEAGGTLIEAERGEFVVNKTSAGRHRSELDALNRSSAAFRKLIDERYVRPAIFSYANKRKDGIVVNASLNSKSMEKELKGLRKDMRKQGATININGLDSRYSWQRN